MVKTVNSKVFIKMTKSGKNVFIDKTKISAKQYRQLSYKKEVVIAEKVSTNCGKKAKSKTSSDRNSDSKSKTKNKAFLNLRSKSLIRGTKNRKKTTKRSKSTASTQQIKRAYLGLAKRHHPNRHSSDHLITKQRRETHFKTAANSYGVLMDETKREQLGQKDRIGKRSKQ